MDNLTFKTGKNSRKNKNAIIACKECILCERNLTVLKISA